MDIWIAIFLVICSTLLTLAVQKKISDSSMDDIKQKVKKKVKSSKKLAEQTNTYSKKEILKVDSNVYVAIGFGLANCIMIEGEDGVVIIDTLESCEVAREVLAEFRKITSKPIGGIILTHFHSDHSQGSQVFLEDAEKQGHKIDIYAHENFSELYDQLINVRARITYKRAVRQFGTEIPEGTMENAGIGINLRLDGSSTLSYVYPTKTFSTRLSVSIGGIELDLLYAPGETNDQIIVWYETKKILFPADNIYKAFPNLYAIRGTMHRDTLQWVQALDIMIKLKPETLVPQHTRPLLGREIIEDTLTKYRDAIQFVHDQTVRYMNKGLTGNEISNIVKLPPHLIDHPYLIEYYGTVEWSVKAVYHGYMGWFSGRPAELHPLPKLDESRLLIELAGSSERVIDVAENSLKEENWQWALQLTDIILDAGNQSNVVIKKAKEIRSEALINLAAGEISAPGMNWYLTEEMVMQGLKIAPNQRMAHQRIKQATMKMILMMFTCMLDCEASQNTILNTLFNFTDSNTKVLVQIRRGVLLVTDEDDDICDKNIDISVITTETVMKKIILKETDALVAALTGTIKVEPGIKQLGVFFSYFDFDQS